MARAWVNPSNDGNGYTCFWRDPNKLQRQKSFRLKGDAESFRAKKERELDTGTYLEAERGAEPVAALFERWATGRGVENSSVRQYRSMLNQAIRPYFKTKTIGTLKLADVQSWIMWMRDTKTYAPQTIQTRFGYLSSALQWAVDNEELGRNPAKRAKLPGKRANVRRTVKGKIVVPELAEVEALITAFDPRYAAMVWVMAGCGLRIAEAMGLCADQVDFRRGVLHVDRQVTEDGGQFRDLPEEDQHAVRKRLKRLRYLSEFVAPLFRQSRVERYLGGLRPAQDALGDYNDALVAGQLARKAARQPPPADGD